MPNSLSLSPPSRPRNGLVRPSAPIYAALCHRILSSCCFLSSPPPSNPHTDGRPSSPNREFQVPATRVPPIDEVAMDGFSLITDHNLLLQSRGMFDGGTDASMFAVADGYASVASYSSESNTLGTEEERMRDKGKDLFFCDLPELGGFDDDFETSMRSYGATDFLSGPGINTTHSTAIQQQTRNNNGRDHTPSSYAAHPVSSSGGDIDRISEFIDVELFGPFDDSIAGVERDEGLEAIVRSNRETLFVPDESTCSGTDLVASAQVPCSKRKLSDPLHGAPDMLLQGMAENPLEMYFPPLTTFEQPEMLTSDTSTRTYEEFVGSTGAPNCEGVRFCPKEMSPAELHEQPRSSTLILEAVPVKDLGFHKLQNGMNQMDVATKGRIRDALYRLANSVEQRHYVASSTRGLAVRSSSSKRFRSGRWTETQTNPMDQSVAQLLLQKRPYRNHVSLSRVV